MTELGVIHGRFQVLHNDHLKYLLAGKSKCRHLVVGITNPDPTLTKSDSADPNRSNTIANILSYFERYTMVRAVLEQAGVEPSEFSIVPFPINLPELYKYYIPLNAIFFLTIYDEWGRKKLQQFQDLGLKTELLWQRPLSQKGITGSDIRKRMINGESWEDMVPAASRYLMELWNIPDRLRNLL